MKYTCDVCGVQEEGYTPMDPPGFWTLVEGVARLCSRCSSDFKSRARDVIAEMKELYVRKYVVAKDYEGRLVYTRLHNGELERVLSRELAEPIPDVRNPFRHGGGFVWSDGLVLEEVERSLA